MRVKFSVAETVKPIFLKETFFSSTILEDFIPYFQNWKQKSCREYFPQKNKPCIMKIQ